MFYQVPVVKMKPYHKSCCFSICPLSQSSNTALFASFVSFCLCLVLLFFLLQNSNINYMGLISYIAVL